MTPFLKLPKFQLCWETARQIIRAYRAQAPKGFDPKMTWVVAAVGVGTAVYGGIQQHQAGKKAESQAKAAAEANQLPAYNPPQMPGFIPYDLAALQSAGTKGDMLAYQRSDSDFKRRHGQLATAENLFEDQVLQDQRGESELSPELQHEFTRAGLAGALESLGDQPTTLAPGSAGEAAVARNLGLSIMGFQDRNRANRTESLKTAEALFPRRQIGMSGSDLVSTMMANAAGENEFNQANYAAEVGGYNNQYQIGSQNQATRQAHANEAAKAKASSDAAMAQSLSSALTGLAKAYGSSTSPTTVTPNTSTTMSALPPGQVSGFTYYPAVGYVRN